MSDSLKRYAQLQMELLEINDELRLLEAAIAKEVKEKGGPVVAGGFEAKFKPGRKSTDHKQAALDNNVNSMLVTEYTVPSSSTSWAKITKKMGLNLFEYEHQAPEILEIKPII